MKTHARFVTIATLAVVCLATSGYAGLLAHFKFEDGPFPHASPIAEETGNLPNARIDNSPSNPVGPTGFGEAISFDGGWDRVNLGTGAGGVVGSVTEDFTIAMWLKPTAGSFYQHLYTSNNNGNGGPTAAYNGYAFIHETRDGETESLQLNTGIGGGVVWSASDYSVPVALTDGAWQHVAVTFANAGGGNYEAKFYVGGVQAGTTVTSTTVPNAYTSDGWSLGASAGGLFNVVGGMDDFRLYDEVLSQAQIAALMSPPMPGTPANPSPANGAGSVPTGTNLDWDDASETQGYEVYLWESSGSKPGTPTATVGVSEYDPPTELAVNTGYSWQIAATNETDSTSGPVWTFTTVAVVLPPPAPITPDPANGATDVAVGTILDWADSSGATSYDVYLWIPPAAKPGTPTANVTDSEYNPPGLLLYTTGYSWQVTAKNSAGSNAGAQWGFTTGTRNPILTWDGESNGLWDEPMNYVFDSAYPVGGDLVTFQGDVNTTVDLNGNQAVKDVVFGDSNAFTIQNNTLALDSGGSITKSNTPTVNQTVSSALSLGGPVTFRNDNNWVHQSHKLILGGAITGSGQITIEGTGNASVQLGGDSSGFTGPIVMNSGALYPAHPNALGDTATGTTVNGGLIWFSSAVNGMSEPITIAADASWTLLIGTSIDSPIQIVNGSSVNAGTGGGNPFTMNGPITGDGNITWGSAQVTLGGSENNTLSGLITVNRQNLTMGKSDGAIAIAGDVDLTSSSGQAQLIWLELDQVADTSAVTASGSSVLNIGWQTDTIASLLIEDTASVDTTGGGVLTVAQANVGGSDLLPGTYTSAQSWIIGEGSVVVVGVGPQVFPITGATWQVGDEALITWEGVSAHTYTLQGASNPVTGTWANVPPHVNMPGVDGTMSVTTPLSASNEVFRVIIP